MADYKVNIELEVNGVVKATKNIYKSQVDFTIKQLKLIANRYKGEWAIFITRKSKANSTIRRVNPEFSRLSTKRNFDMDELQRLRDKGYSWKLIGAQLYSNAETVRRYFRDNKKELDGAENEIC